MDEELKEEIEGLRALRQAGVEGEPITSKAGALMASLSGAVANLKERSRAAGDDLVRSIADPSRRCGLACRGSGSSPADPARFAAYQKTSDETGPMVAAASIAAAFDRALRSVSGGKYDPACVLAVADEVAALWPAAEAAIGKAERQAAINLEFEVGG